MTRRERLEAKVERRRDWAAGRRGTAAASYAYTDRYRGDVAFNTQPGHIPERARVIRMIDRAHGDLAMADHHEAKAAGLEGQLERSVFSDDADAIAQLEARIAAREAEGARIKALNRAIRREMKAGLSEGWLDQIGATDDERRAILANVQHGWKHEPAFPPYVLANLRGRIAADRERITGIRARQARAAQAQAAGGVVVEGAGEYVRVTFAEKPPRATLDALKVAGFMWGGGSWSGRRDRLPEEVV